MVGLGERLTLMDEAAAAQSFNIAPQTDENGFRVRIRIGQAFAQKPYYRQLVKAINRSQKETSATRQAYALIYALSRIAATRRI